MPRFWKHLLRWASCVPIAGILWTRWKAWSTSWPEDRRKSTNARPRLTDSLRRETGTKPKGGDFTTPFRFDRGEEMKLCVDLYFMASVFVRQICILYIPISHRKPWETKNGLWISQWKYFFFFPCSEFRSWKETFASSAACAHSSNQRPKRAKLRRTTSLSTIRMKRR